MERWICPCIRQKKEDAVLPLYLVIHLTASQKLNKVFLISGRYLLAF